MKWTKITKYLLDMDHGDYMEIDFLSIKKGDCQIITFFHHFPGPNYPYVEATTFLIDAGIGSGAAIDHYVKVKQRKIDNVIISHWDDDHYSGLLEIINGDKFDEIFFNQYPNLYAPETGKEKNGVELILSRFKKEPLKKGEEIYSDNGFRLYCVSIDNNLDPGKYHYPDDTNSSSVGICIDDIVLGYPIYFTAGDIPKEIEWEIIDKFFKDIKNRFRVFKFNHHGSLYSNSEEMLSLFLPVIGVVCNERNNFRPPPAYSILELACHYGILIHFTNPYPDNLFPTGFNYWSNNTNIIIINVHDRNTVGMVAGISIPIKYRIIKKTRYYQSRFL